MNNEVIKEKDYVLSVKKYHKKFAESKKMVIFDRESTPGQKENLVAREPVLREVCERNDWEVIGYFPEIVNGRSDRLSKRKEFLKAFQFAKANNAALFIVCVNRLMRHANVRKDARLTKDDIRRLDKYLAIHDLKMSDIKIVSLIPPDTSREKIRGRFIKIGQYAKANYGGRPRKPKLSKKERREKFKPIALEMHCEKELSVTETMAEIEHVYDEPIARSTIGDWLNPKSNTPENTDEP